MTSLSKTETPFQVFLRGHFPNQRFLSKDLKVAGNYFSKGGVDKAVETLTGKSIKGEVPDIRPPAKGTIVAFSRPLEEWPLYKFSVAVQQRVNAKPRSEVFIRKTDPVTKKEKEVLKVPSGAEEVQAWVMAEGVNTYGLKCVQGFNLIFRHAYRRYAGVELKVSNKVAKAEAQGKTLDEEDRTAYTSDGYLKHPPGLNPNFYCFQQMKLRPYTAETCPNVRLPLVYQGYQLDPKSPLESGVQDRLAITKGNPGYIPEHMRGQVRQGRRFRQWFSASNHRPKPAKWNPILGRMSKGRTSTPNLAKLSQVRAKGALLVVLSLAEDWVVLDVRGLLRNATWRKCAPVGMSLEDLLGLFSQDPVLDPIRGTATFLYNEGVLPLKKRNIERGRRTKKTLEDLTAPKEDKANEVGLVSIDLGQSNVMAIGYYRIGQTDKVLQSTLLESKLTPPELDTEFLRYRDRYNAFEARIEVDALAAIPQASRDEILLVRTHGPKVVKEVLAQQGVRLNRIPWDQVSANTSYISDDLIDQGKSDAAFFQGVDKKTKKPKTLKKSDGKWVSETKPKVSDEVRKQFNEASWALRRTNLEYHRFSRSKSELARRCTNHVLRTAHKLSACKEVVVVVEDLNVGFFHGKGRRQKGFENLFKSKSENRWFIQAMHKALTDLATNRGVRVFEVAPARTSITCPFCAHCDPKNRGEDGNREAFRCTSCGRSAHADREVATSNIMKVALQGHAMPLAECERIGDAKKPKVARTRKPSNPTVPPLTLVTMDTARKPEAKSM